MTYKYNPFTDKLDKTNSKAEMKKKLDDVYVNETGDTMTGPLIVEPSSGTTSITIKAGTKLIFDG